MSTYNSFEYVAQSIESILAQSYSNWELIITDDGSKDKTIQVLKEYTDNYSNVHFFKFIKNQGAAKARNNSLEQAKGDFIAFLDADDLWTKDKLEKQINFMLNHDASICFTSYGIIDKQGNDLGQIIDKNDLGTINYDDLLCKKATFGCSTVMVDKHISGDFRMPLLRTGQDYATWLMLLKKIKIAHHLPEALSRYRITPGSISRNKFKKAKRQWQIYREIEKLNIFQSCYCFIFYAYRAIFRK